MVSHTLLGGRRGRRLTAVLAVVALVAAAGCAGIGGSGGASASPQLDSVPAQANSVAYMNVQGMAGDSTLRDIANTYLNQSAHANPSGPSSVDGAMSQIKNDTNLDPSKLGSVTAFSNSSQAGSVMGVGGGVAGGGSGQQLSGAIVTSSFAKSHFHSVLNNQSTTSYKTQTYKGKTLWVNKPQFGQAQAIGWLGDGTFAAGTPSSVKAVVDVRAGDASALSGSVRSTFENTHDGYVRFAAAIPQNQFDASQYQSSRFNTAALNSIQTVSGALYTSGDSVGFTTDLTTSSKSDASDVKDVTSGAVSLYRGMISDGPIKTLVKQVSVSKDGSTVTISAEASASKVDKAIKSAYNSPGSLFSGSAGSSTASH